MIPFVTPDHTAKCPFGKLPGPHETMLHGSRAWFYVVCSCGARGPTADSKEAAIEVWGYGQPSVPRKDAEAVLYELARAARASKTMDEIKKHVTTAEKALIGQPTLRLMETVAEWFAYLERAVARRDKKAREHAQRKIREAIRLVKGENRG